MIPLPKQLFWSILGFLSLGFILSYLQPNLIKNVAGIPTPICDRCNIIVITIDPLRADNLPCYGHTSNTAQHICSFIDRNIRFTDAYSQSSWTLPSIMSFLTSVYPRSHGMFTPLQDVLLPNIETLPQALKKTGYKTVYVGETDDAHMPMDKGFARGFDFIHENSYPEDWLEQIKETMQASESSPTFLYLHTFALRGSYAEVPESFSFDPLFAPPFSFDTRQFTESTRREAVELLSYVPIESSDVQKTAQLLIDAQTLSDARRYFLQLPEALRKTIITIDLYFLLNPTNPTHMRYARNMFDEHLLKLDERLAPTLELIGNSEFTKNTIVILMSNHGDEFGEHLAVGHGRNLFATTTHVPLAFSIPGIPPQTIRSLVQTIDIYPTLLASIGAPIPKTVKGINRVPLLTGKGASTQNTYAVAQLDTHIELSAIRSLEWSYYSQTEQSPSGALYDLVRDPGEQTNVIASYPAVLQTLKAALDKTE